VPASQAAWLEYVDNLQPDERELLRINQLDSTGVVLATTASAAQAQADGSRAKAVAEKLNPLLRLVNRYSGAIQFAAQFAPAPASVVAQGIDCVITIPQMFLKYQKLVSDRLVQMEKRFSILGRYYDNLHSDDECVQEALIRVYIDIIKFCLEAANLLFDKKRKVKGTAKIAVKSIVQTFEESKLGSLASKFDDDVAEFKEALEGAERNSNDRVQRDTSRELGDIKSIVVSTEASASQIVDEMNRMKQLERDLAGLIRELNGKMSPRIDWYWRTESKLMTH
jgi:hypothetical protein